MSTEVLIIDDDPSIRLISSKILDHAGHTTHEAHNRDHALEIVQKEPNIKVMLLDITMPGMPLKEFVERSIKINQELRIIFSSGQTRDTISEYLNTNKNFQFLPKPYGMKELTSAMSTMD